MFVCLRKIECISQGLKDMNSWIAKAAVWIEIFTYGSGKMLCPANGVETEMREVYKIIDEKNPGFGNVCSWHANR